MITLLPVAGLPEITAGDDLAALIAGCAQLHDGDVVVVSQKVVSKAEGRVTQPAPGEDLATARRRLARSEAARVVADAPWALIVQTRHGFVCANAGVDASNAAGGLVLLPLDPDASAAALRAGLRAIAGVDVAVVVSDTFGRPWRMGQTDVAIGVAGLAPVRDERGSTDRDGMVLEVTEVAVADELAGAADLVRDKAAGVPVVIVRGWPHRRDDSGAAFDLVRPAETDLFARGRGMLARVLAATPQAAADDGVSDDDLALLRPLAADLAVADPGPPTVLQTADAFAAGLVTACLVDMGYAVSWSRHGKGFAIAAARPLPPR